MTSTDRVRRTDEPIRKLSADDLGYGVERALAEHASNRLNEPELADDDGRIVEARRIAETFGGLILTGPPGTSKSWYAAKIANALAGDATRVRYVQFHPSYQYEDFMEGYVPRKGGDGFVLKDKIFLDLCAEAEQDPGHLWILVIDELSRGDPARIFGEALTYVERSKRNLSFELASGSTRVVPDNVFIVATMNPLDRGVDEVDAAFERRFAKMAMEPDSSILEEILDLNGFDDSVVRPRLNAFFRSVNSRAKHNPQAAVGHTFFTNVKDVTTLQEVWDYQLRFLIERAYRLDPAGFEEVETNWKKMFRGLVPDEDDASHEQGVAASTDDQRG